jgi:polyphosphate kinase 2 (PPK2 family)
VIFDRSWYNRAGVEYVMGFCTPEQHKRFLENCPAVEAYIHEAGIRLIKIWLEVGQEEQEKRFYARIEDPMRQWKLSPMDVESYKRWYDYSKARDLMFKYTDTEGSPWYLVDSNDKKRARLNIISHILAQIPYKRVKQDKVRLPDRSKEGKYDDAETIKGRRFIEAKF